MDELKFRNFIKINGRSVPFSELDEKTKKEVSGELSKRFYNAVGLNVTLEDSDREEATG